MESRHLTNEKKIETSLGRWLSDARKVVVVGIGNPLRKDDSVGVKAVRNLQNKVSQFVYVIECETVPESFIEPITEFKPSHILIIDAALLNLKPGSSKLVKPDKIAEQLPISTHALPLKIFCEYLSKTTKAKIALLLIQPGDTSFGEDLTAEVKETAEHLANLLPRILP